MSFNDLSDVSGLENSTLPKDIIDNKILDILYLACVNDNIVVIHHLIELIIVPTSGIGINKSRLCNNINNDDGDNNNYWSILGIACYKGYTNIVKLLLTHPDINVNSHGHYSNDNIHKYMSCSPLYLSCMTNRLDIVNLLLNCNDIDTNFGQEGNLDSNYSPLMVACQSDNYDIVFVLLDRYDVDVNYKTSKHGAH